MDEVELLTVAEAARRLSLSRTVVYRLMREGEVADIKVGRSRRVTAESVREFVRRNAPDPAERRRRARKAGAGV